jgi:voltage-gated potassium channel
MKKKVFRKHPFYKVITAILCFFAVILFGTIGFIIIEHFNFTDAFYMSMITISTVGFEEVHHLSPAGKWFTIFLIGINLSLLTVIVSNITQYFLDGNFQAFYKQYKMEKRISHLRNHVIVCGFGRNGKAAAQLIMKNNTAVVVLEKNESTEFREDELRYCLHADATRDEVLVDAGINHASALITTLPDDADNLFIVLTAKELNPSLRIISRASNDTSIRKLKTAGATEVIMPDKIGGIHMATMVINPDVKAFIDYMANQTSDVQINEITIRRSVRLSELDCWKSTGATIIGMKRGGDEYVLNPSEETTIHEGDRLIVLGFNAQLKKVKELVG